MSWPAVIAIAWPALSLAACALWARHRRREKQAARTELLARIPRQTRKENHR